MQNSELIFKYVLNINIFFLTQVLCVYIFCFAIVHLVLLSNILFFYNIFIQIFIKFQVLCVYIFCFAIVHLVLLSRKRDGFLNALSYSPGTVWELVICFFSVWSVCGLSGFHSYLIALALTTNEDIKGTWSKSRNRFVIFQLE